MNVRVTVMQAFLQEFGADPNITSGSVFGDTFCQDLIRKNDTMKIQHQRHHLIWQEYLSLDSPFTDCLQQRILI